MTTQVFLLEKIVNSVRLKVFRGDNRFEYDIYKASKDLGYNFGLQFRIVQL